MPELVVYLGMANDKPYVAAAFVCEKVLREPDGVSSIIRIVDHFTVPVVPDDLPSKLKHGLELTAFVSLKSGDVTGRHPVHLRLNYPSGKTKELPPLAEEFKGQAHGVNYTFQLMLEVREFGLYWFDVVWDEDASVLTRIPFTLQKAEGKPQRS